MRFLVPVLLTLSAAAAESQETIRPDAVLLRYPDISATQVVFRYAGDLWLVEKQGGVARRVTTAEGNESFAKFSPDGSRVAFLGGYDGGSDLYVLDLAAGIPERVTWHPGQEVLSDWTPDGEALLYWSSEVSGLGRAPRVLRVDADGGQPEPLPMPYGTFSALDASGKLVAYTLGTREFRTWKRYRGGMAQDIWLFDLATNEARRLTDHPGTDSMPMWHGREVVFLSDRGADQRLNLFAHHVDTGATRQLTSFTDFDVKFPAMGPDDVVFEAGGKLMRYEFATGERFPIDVVIPGERPELRARTNDVASLVQSVGIGPTGKRVVVAARGDVFTVPVENGVTRNLTATSGVAERNPEWSPDGQFIAYWSDATGEYELTLCRSDGKSLEGGLRQDRLTELGAGWKGSISWSPDSETIAFTTHGGGLHLLDVESGEVETIATDPDGQQLQVDWSADSGWLAWSMRHSSSRLNAIHLYEVATGTLSEVTSGMFDDTRPVFDEDGDWLFFASTRTFSPLYEDLGTTWIYANSRRLLAVPLRADVENPWAPENDEEEFDEDADEDEGADGEQDGDAEEHDDDGEHADEADDTDGAADGDDDAKDADDGEESEEDAALVIELDGFEARALLLPVDAGQVGNLEGAAGKVLYVRGPNTGANGGGPSLRFYDMAAKEEKTIVDGVAGYIPSADGKKLLLIRGNEAAVVDLAPGQSFEAIDSSGLVATTDPRAEWAQILEDVYRLYRDFFYEEGLHGVDWRAVCDRYAAVLPDVTSRADVHYLIGEMISELNIGHAYNRTPPSLRGGAPARPVGLLGCDWALENGAYRVTGILGSAAPYDADARSPLAVQGVDVAVGDYLLAVNGVPVDTASAVHRALEGTAGRPTELTVNAAPTFDGEERTVLVTPAGDEGGLRYRDWVARNRARVAELSGGRVGYVHVPDTGIRGQNELVRQFLGQFHHEALIVDERWNGGGQIPTRFIELLDRPLTNYWAVRAGEDWDWPPVGHRGPKCMLINGWSGSGGDAFPYYFRQSGLGKLIGRRTWGGLVGISGNPGLIDGASVTVPRFAFYELDGTWGVEGHGVEPDIEVLDDPSLMVNGGDPQLEVAVRQMLEELETWQPALKRRPGNPDRSGSGITPEDH
jgi:tricorn protease